jgi:hypothetical protein
MNKLSILLLLSLIAILAKSAESKPTFENESKPHLENESKPTFENESKPILENDVFWRFFSIELRSHNFNLR